KGEARMLGLAAVGQLAHAAEDLLHAARDNKAAEQSVADLLLRVCDLVSDLLDDLEVAQSGNEASQALCRLLAGASGRSVPPLTAVTGAPKQGSSSGGSNGSQASPAVDPASAAGASAGAPESTPQDRTIRVNVEILDTLGSMAGDLLVESARARLRASELNG